MQYARNNFQLHLLMFQLITNNKYLLPTDIDIPYMYVLMRVEINMITNTVSFIV